MPIQAQPPQPQQSNPYVPTELKPLVFEQFDGINTTTTRPGVPDAQAYWLDGFMPIAPRKLQTLYDLGTTLYTRTAALTVVFFEFYTISFVPYMIVFMSNGSAVQVNMLTQAATTVLPAGTIPAPSMITVGVSQWSQQYLIIVAKQPNGYWVWDGATLYSAGSLSPVIVITDAGNAYSSPPAILTTSGSGGGASIIGQISGGVVTGASMINAGSGWLASDGPTISLTFIGGNPGGSLATITVFTAATPAVAGSGATFVAGFTQYAGSSPPIYGITSVAVTNGGSNYSAFTTLQISALSGYIVQAQLSPVISGGVITGVTIVSIGQYYGYQLGNIHIAAHDSGSAQFTVSSVNIAAAGVGYSNNPAATFSGGGGPIQQAAIGVTASGGSIVTTSIISRGLYTSSVVPTISVTDNPSTATGYASLMPFGISGTSVETYQGYVWIVSDAVLYNSAPGSISDFATSSGGGNQTSASSRLRIGYTKLIAANGILYTIADSSIDYVSGVQTAGSPISTTYSWLNADPETGTPYPKAAMAFGRGLFLCNAFGIHVVYGSQAQKISEPLDGVYNTVANFNAAQLSVAEHTMFGRKIAVALIPIVDPVSGVSATKLLCYDGKRWFASSQSKTLTYIKHQEVNSILTAYGTDGTIVAPIFSTASNAFTKTAQTRLWDAPGGYQFDKGASRFWAMANYNSSVSTSLVVGIDSVNNQGTYGSVTYTVAGPAATGLYVFPAQAVGQQGPLMGMTLKTNCSDMQLISAMLQPNEAEYRG